MIVEMNLLHELEADYLASVQDRLVHNEAAWVEEIVGLQRKLLVLTLYILQLG